MQWGKCHWRDLAAVVAFGVCLRSATTATTKTRTTTTTTSASLICVIASQKLGEEDAEAYPMLMTIVVSLANIRILRPQGLSAQKGKEKPNRVGLK